MPIVSDTSDLELAQNPTEPDRVSSIGKIPRWSRKAIKSFAMAELEARKLKYLTSGTGALLMGILIEGDGGEITATDMVLAIWSEVESPGHKIMVALGFNDEKAIELDSSSFDSGYLDD